MTDESTADTTTTDALTQYVGTDGKPLSPRQNEVYAMHKLGTSNVDIAKSLGIAAGTVSNALVAAKTRMGESTPTITGDMDITQVMGDRLTRIDASIVTHTDAIATLTAERSKIVVIMAALDGDDDITMGEVLAENGGQDA